MPNPGCFLYVPNDERLEDRVDRDGKVTDVFRSSEVGVGRQVALVSWDGESLHACAVMAAGGRVAAYKTRVRLTHFSEGIGVSLTELARRLAKPERDRFREALDGGQLDTETTAAVRKALVDHYPDAAQAWEFAEAEAAREQPELWPAERVPAIAYERDAVGLALTFAGLDRDPVMSDWDGDTEAPFLKGLSTFRVYEDAAIVHDTTVFGEWTGLAPSVVGVARGPAAASLSLS